MKISNFKLKKVQPGVGDFMPPSFWATVDVTKTKFLVNRTKTVSVFKNSHGAWRWQDTGVHTPPAVVDLALAYTARQYQTQLESCTTDE